MSSQPETAFLGPRFDAALVLAHRIHRTQVHKGSGIPYIAHVLGVAAIVLEYGGDEDAAIAGLLHDTLEDAPKGVSVDYLREVITRDFGPKVLAIVEHCTDTDVQPKPPWRERKMRYLAHLAGATQDALLVSAADKLHNAQALLRDYRACGEKLWDRFNKEAGRAGTLGYYRALADTFTPRLQNPIAQDLARAVSAFEGEVGERFPWPPAARS